MLDFALYCQVEFGAYAQPQNLTKNNMCTCTTRATTAIGPSRNYQGDMLFYSLSINKTLNRSKNGFIIVLIPEDDIQEIAFMAQESPTGLVFQDWLETPYDDGEDTGAITIRFTNTPHPMPDMNPDTRIIDTYHQDLNHTANPGDSLNNTGNIDPDTDHITIRITGINDQVPSNSTIDEDPVEELDNDDVHDIEQTGFRPVTHSLTLKPCTYTIFKS